MRNTGEEGQCVIVEAGRQLPGWVVVTQKRENGEEWTWRKVAGSEK